jgi:flagellar biosynthesis/type III secretory pathway protein FliH
MSQSVSIQLEKPIASVRLLDVAVEDPSTTPAEAKQAELLQLKKEGLTQACQALRDAVNKVNESQKNMLSDHKEQIAKLSVEIARKILVQRIQEGDYEIESIVKEALKNAPAHQDVVVHLNPEDLTQCKKTLEGDPGSTLEGIKFVADPNIGRAECLLETPKGIIQSFINEHIERISEALKKAE